MEEMLWTIIVICLCGIVLVILGMFGRKSPK